MKTSVRGVMLNMNVGDSVSFSKKEVRQSYVRQLCYGLGEDYGRGYTSSAPRESEYIKVTRIS